MEVAIRRHLGFARTGEIEGHFRRFRSDMREVAEGRPQKYFGAAKFWPIKAEPTGLPLLTIRLPAAWPGNATVAMPVTTSG